MRSLYVAWLERGNDPSTFWSCTFGEVMILLRSYEFRDELQWMHTSAVMAMLANIHRAKNARAYEWTDFNPYSSSRKKSAAPKITAKHTQLFDKMSQALNRKDG
jgi:hypothetical protein